MIKFTPFLLNYIVCLFLHFKIIKSINEQFLYKCLKDDLKMKKICAIEGSDIYEDEETLTPITIDYFYIKEMCDTDESCKLMIDSTKTIDSKLYQCFPKLKKLKIGEACSVNEECYTGFCSMSICMGIDFEADCTDYPNGCKPGTYCAYNTILDKSICVEYASINELCGYSDALGYDKECFPGTICQVRDDNSGTTVCKKWGTFGINKEVTDERLCQTGMAYNDSEVDGRLKCVSVDEDAECDEQTHKCNPLILGIGPNPDYPTEKILDCVGGLTNMYACPLSNTKIELYKQYIEEFNKRYDREKLEKSQYFKEGYFNDETLTELYIKYMEYEYLWSYEIVDFDGNINGLYTCEYDFIWTFLYSNYIKYSIIKFIAILVFLQ